MATSAVREARLPQVTLPELRPFKGAGLEPDGDYDGVRFEGLDLSGTDGGGATLLDVGMYRCALDEARLTRLRVIDSVLEGVWGVGTDLAGGELRDVELRDARLGGVQLHGARLNRVLVRGGKIDYLNLRQAQLTDVTFEGCVLTEPDFGGASLERVAFRDCVLRRAEFHQVRFENVDLRGATELDIATGVGNLAGAVVSSGQLMELAPAFAAQLGVRVED
ncbi:pentapeptide repeat-containing protein [Streptomyces reniochalinae]|uniref:Pentapeptide repeat-containing protein n=1 Tax=Streptomyces reniochalinae TaxID=2250578 RepID=A0A367EJC7_9ACTN|nr:pentapeptide repeat-containing protein [Streptomyces reniochalinae]RCG18063.1 pentapeptide repeat-containing protein [Streptomyces reniochalinae]